MDKYSVYASGTTQMHSFETYTPVYSDFNLVTTKQHNRN